MSGHIGTMSDAGAAAPIGCPKTDIHAAGKVYKRGDCKRKYTADAEQPRFPDHVKRQAVQMRIEDASISAAARVMGGKHHIGEWLGQKWGVQ